MIQNIEAANKRNMKLKYQLEQILAGSSQLSSSEAQEIWNQAEREFGVKKEALKAKASGFNWDRLLTLLLGLFGLYMILSTLDQ